MKQAFFCLCGIFATSAASATVYDGSYSGTTTITNDSIFEKNSTFSSGRVNLENGITVNVMNGVSFIGAPIDASGNTSAYTLNLMGDNITFRNSKSGAIVAGLKDYTAFSSALAGNVNVNISGSNILFDNNSVSGSYPSNRGGAIFIGLPNSAYYNGTQQQILSITGIGTVFSNNSASTSGGAIYSSGATVDMQQAVRFTNNSAYSGGAIYNSVANTARKVTANLHVGAESEFIKNKATGTGGAIYNDSYTYIGVRTVFDGNTAAQGGAIYNAGEKGLIDIDTGNGSFVRFVQNSDSIYNAGGVINFLGTGTIQAENTSLTSVRGTCNGCNAVVNLGKSSSVFDTVTLQDNTTLKTTVWRDGDIVKAGNISAKSFNIQNNDEVRLMITIDSRDTLSLSGDTVNILIDLSNALPDGWDYFGNPDKHPCFSIENNRLYDIEFVSDGVYKITPKEYSGDSPWDYGDIMDSAASAWGIGGFITGSIAADIATQLYILSQFDSTLSEYNDAINGLIPETTNALTETLSTRISANMRLLSQRLVTDKTGFWATGGYKTFTGDGYAGNTFGGLFGQDITFMNGLLTLGQAFGYSQSSLEAGVRHYDINQSFDMSLYGRIVVPFNSTDLYLGGILNYGAYSIKENKTVLGYDIDSDIDADQTSAQVIVGAKRGLLGGDIGYRYTNIGRGGYIDSVGQRVSGINTDFSRALARLYLTDSEGLFQWGLYLGSECSLDGTSEYTNTVLVPNGQRYIYTVKSNNNAVATFGANIDFAIAQNMTLGIAYDGLMGGNYSEHIGRLRFHWDW